MFALRSMFSSTLIGGPADVKHVIEAVTAPVESGVLLRLPSGIHAHASDHG